MKLVIASDIHGSARWCRALMELVERENPDRLILLGDLLYHGPRNDLPEEYAPKQVIPMLSRYAEKIIAVRGNCEAEVDQMVSLHGRLFPADGGRKDPLSDPRSSRIPGKSAAAAEGQCVPLRPHPCEAGRDAWRHPLFEPGQRVHPQGRQPQLSDL